MVHLFLTTKIKTRRRFSGGILVEIKREALCRTREGLDRPALEPPAEVAATYSVKSGTAKFPPRRKSMHSHQDICNRIPRKCSKLSLTAINQRPNSRCLRIVKMINDICKSTLVKLTSYQTLLLATFVSLRDELESYKFALSNCIPV